MENEMIAKKLRMHGIKASYNDEGEFGIIKPHHVLYTHSQYGTGGFGRLVTFKIEDGIIRCCEKDCIYNLHEPKSLKLLVRSIQLCEQRTDCHPRCEFKKP